MTPVPAAAQGETGSTPARSCLATGLSVEAFQGEPNHGAQGSFPLGNVCSASSSRRRGRSSANGLGLAGLVGLGMDSATG